MADDANINPNPPSRGAAGSGVPPADGRYLAWNSRQHEWEPKWWSDQRAGMERHPVRPGSDLDPLAANAAATTERQAQPRRRKPLI